MEQQTLAERKAFSDEQVRVYNLTSDNKITIYGGLDKDLSEYVIIKYDDGMEVRFNNPVYYFDFLKTLNK